MRRLLYNSFAEILRCPGVDLQRVPDVLLSVWAVLDIVECRIYRKFRFAAELIDIVCSSEAKILTQKDLVTLLTYLRLVVNSC